MFKIRHGLGGEIGDGFDEADELDAYVRGWRDGEMSAIGRCFDIGATIARALRLSTSLANPLHSKQSSQPTPISSLFPINFSSTQVDTPGDPARQLKRQQALQTIVQDLYKPSLNGNGELTHVIPVGLAYHRYVVGNGVCLTEVVTRGYRRGIRGNIELPNQTPPCATLRISLPSKSALPSAGHIFYTLVTALRPFFVSSSFGEGAVFCVNMGNGAAKVGAVYGGIAGFWYDRDEEELSGLFWGGRVRR
ncbi:hypothetical protein AB1N83_013266 [Pleurotus pulmonarius]